MENKISKRQFISFLSSFFMGNGLALLGGVSRGEKIGYITIFFSFFLFIFLVCLYSYLFNKFNTSDLFIITEKVAGKTLSKIIIFSVFIYSLFTALISSVEFLFFVELSSDFSFNPFSVSALFFVCIFAILLCGKKALIRYSEIILPFVITVLAFVLFSGTCKINLSNLKIEEFPSISYISSNTFLNFISPFSNIILAYFITSDLFSKNEIKKASIKAGLISLLIISALYLMNLLIIGKNLMNSLYFPTLYTFGVINPSIITQRSESAFFITYIFFDILHVAVSYFCAISCFKRLFGKKNISFQGRKKIFLIVLPILSFIAMNLKFDINLFYSSFSKIPILASIITLGIPAILFVVSIFKKSCRSQSLNNNPRPQ